MEAVRESPQSSATTTARATPITARLEFLSRISPGSGATNILFTAVCRPLQWCAAGPATARGWWAANGHGEGAALRSGLVAARRCAAP